MLKIVNVATKEELEKCQHLLSDNYKTKDLVYLAAKDDEEYVGILGILFEEDQCSLEWIYVDEAYRGQKVATTMMKTLFDFLEQESDYLWMTSQFMDENGLFDFFSSFDDVDIDVSHIKYKITKKDLQASRMYQGFLQDKSETEDNLISIKDCNQALLRDFFASQKEDGELNVIDEKAYRGKLIEELSFCQVTDRKITAIILVTEEDDGLCISYINSENKMLVGQMVKKVCQVSEGMVNDKPLYAEIVTDESAKLFKHFFPKNSNSKNVYLAVWDI